MLSALVLSCSAVGYYSVRDVRLDCQPAMLSLGSANGVAMSPDGTTVSVSNSTYRQGVDPIVFSSVRSTTICSASLYTGSSSVPRYCTAGGVKARYVCPSAIDSSACWTQTVTSASNLDYRREFAVTWENCGVDCQIAVTWHKPHWFDDVLAMLVCSALLGIAISLPHVKTNRDLLLNWAFACCTLSISHERLPLQPLWSHGVLAATAAAGLATRGTRLETILIALIAATLPSRSIGASAVRIIRFVMGIGLCGWAGYRVSIQSILGAVWSSASLLYPVSVTAGGNILDTAMVAVSAAIAGWASNFNR